VVSGRGVEAAYLKDGRGLIAWSGHDAVRASVAGGAPQDLAPVVSDGRDDLGLSDLAVSGNAAVVTLGSPLDDLHVQVLAAPLAPGAAAFGPAEQVASGGFLGRSSAGFAGGKVWVAWGDPDARAVEVAQRPTP
jgi:hypothetical protein